jgi:hypothetical protein
MMVSLPHSGKRVESPSGAVGYARGERCMEGRSVLEVMQMADVVSCVEKPLGSGDGVASSRALVTDVESPYPRPRHHPHRRPLFYR